MSEMALPKGRLYMSPEEIFVTKLTEKLKELEDSDGTVGRPELLILLAYVRELVNFAEDFPDEEPVGEADVEECLRDLDFDSVGLAMAERLSSEQFMEYARGFYSAIRAV